MIWLAHPGSWGACYFVYLRLYSDSKAHRGRAAYIRSSVHFLYLLLPSPAVSLVARERYGKDHAVVCGGGNGLLAKCAEPIALIYRAKRFGQFL
jgi:hypothetical protein